MKYLNLNRGFAGGLLLVGAAILIGGLTSGYLALSNIQDTNRIVELERVLQDQNQALLDTQASMLALQDAELTLGAFNPVGGLTYTLAGAGVGSTNTTITLNSFKAPVSGTNLTMSDFGSIGYLTLEPGNPNRQEFISFTGVTQNSDGTATLTGVTRGLSPVAPYTESSTYKKAHPGGSQASLSNSPAFYTQFPKKANDETITGQWSFTTFPITASSSFASTTASGWVELATGLEAASSTSSGDIASSSLALHTGISTSTAPASGHVIPVTGIDGNLPEGFIPTTLAQNYDLTGTTTFTGPTVFNGSITGHASTTFTVYTASTTWSKPAGLEYIEVEVIGGGGGGGNGTDSGSGGGGGYAKKIIPASLLGNTETITIGVGGITNTAGGNTTFTVTNGTNVVANGGTAGAGGVGTGSGAGTGGTATGGDLNITGGNGLPRYTNAADFFYGGGTPYGNNGTGYGSGGHRNGGTGTQGVVTIKAHF